MSTPPPTPPPEGFITGITWPHIAGYYRGTTSLFRQYQATFVARYGAELTGEVVELGGDRRYGHEKLVPNAARFISTNVQGEYDRYLDVTDMQGVPDDSQDAYLCISVLEHVLDAHRALTEIHRTLKVGGQLLLTVPFAYPYHDTVDYWRFNRDVYLKLFPEYEILHLIRLGGTFSTLTDILQRPKGVLNRRYLVYKSLGVMVAVLGKLFDTMDGFPLGYGLHAVKRR